MPDIYERGYSLNALVKLGYSRQKLELWIQKGYLVPDDYTQSKKARYTIQAVNDAHRRWVESCTECALPERTRHTYSDTRTRFKVIRKLVTPA